MSARRFARWIIVLLVTIVSASHARVYMRWGSGEQQHLAPELTGWMLAAEQELVVNGQPGQMQVFGARESGANALIQLRRLYEQRGAQVSAFSDRDAAWGLAVWPDRRTTFLILSHRAFPRPLIMLHHTMLTADHHPPDALPGIPDYPGAQGGSTVWQPNSSLGTRFLRTTSSPDDILIWYDQALGQAGWIPTLTDRLGRRADGPLAVYMQGTDLCVISVSPITGSPGENMITLLLKK